MSFGLLENDLMITCSAPGKIYLFGEHAVVYGEPAIACAVELRTHVSAKRSDAVTISSGLGTTGLDYEIHPYVSSVIEKLGVMEISVDISSDLPVGSGLGSSAAVTIATLAAINTELGLGYSHRELARMGHEIEQEVQGAASPTDTFVSTFGGVVEITSRKRLDSLDCGIVIGNTNRPKKTAVILEEVKRRIKDFPDIMDSVIKTIGSITKRGEISVLEKDYRSLGRLMNINHGLLDALGVGTAELSALVYAARNAGAFGAKITGAGGGGCMVALTDSPLKVASAIEAAGGQAIITRSTPLGVVQE
ncbi:mevalonate kinase [Candidatus Methanoperedens nitroreducens]|uniref:Mevalonate kinase n=2 Tax=Candidatus Methanoperedens nitratireducens TaxID=1392998 RepID=A0A062VD54_9EURY|nr:mevalonate kinase [Candidatus Methanoperedens nitroreducens]MDJ1422861.1 mevalonate kinase [Candidatus Methanoperedens sp.]